MLLFHKYLVGWQRTLPPHPKWNHWFCLFCFAIWMVFMMIHTIEWVYSLRWKSPAKLLKTRMLVLIIYSRYTIWITKTVPPPQLHYISVVQKLSCPILHALRDWGSKPHWCVIVQKLIKKQSNEPSFATIPAPADCIE